MMQHALIAYLVNAAWQAPLIAVVAVAVSRLAGLSPRSRNLVWLSFLIMAIMTPALAVDWNPSTAAPAAALTAAAPGSQAPATEAQVSANLAQANPLRLLRVELDARSASAIRLVFVTAAAIALARLALAGVGARRLVRESSHMVVPDQLADAMADFARLHRFRVPEVRTSARIAAPVVVGALTPKILVPERFAALSVDDQRAALLHEMAHVVRRDYAVNLASEVAAVPLSWHPAVYGIKTGVRRTRELACDAMASAAMASDEAYARCLLSLAKSLRAPAKSTPANASPAWGVREASMVGLFGKSDLEDRLMQLLRPKTPEERGVKVVRLGGAAAIAALALTPAVMFRVAPALAESPPGVVSTAPVAPDATPTPEPSPMPDAVETPDSAQPPGAASDAAAQASEEAARDAAPKSRSHLHRHAHPAAPASGASPADQPVIADVPHLPALPHVAELPRLPEAPHIAELPKLPIAGVLISSDGKDLVLADSGAARRIADEQRRKWEAEVRCALERAREDQQAQTRAFNQQLSELVARQSELARINREQLQKRLEAARAAINDARVKQALAEAQEKVASAAMRESQIEAAKVRREIERAMRDAAKARTDADSARTEL